MLWNCVLLKQKKTQKFNRFDGNKISNGTWDSNGLG